MTLAGGYRRRILRAFMSTVGHRRRLHRLMPGDVSGRSHRKERLVLNQLLASLKNRRLIFSIVAGALLIAYLAAPYPSIAMWVGFLFAAYSAVANDSIQTLGTFIASNRDKPWWLCWIFTSVVFVATVLYSWFLFDGDVSHGRLKSKGFEQAPEEFFFLQLAAPVFLWVLTRLKMPVSTTFLLLSCFAASSQGLNAVIAKSVNGYGYAFVCSIALWSLLGRWMQRNFTGKPHPAWRWFQWMTTGCLWSVWLMQDAANIAVYLPRSLSLIEFLVFTGVIVAGLGLLFKMSGESIQQVVDEKSKIVDVRSASVIDLIYAILLYWFKSISETPMSTTWVFIGLLAGRELGMELTRSGEGKGAVHALRLMGKDLLNVTIGFVISLLLAVTINPNLREDVAELLRAVW